MTCNGFVVSNQIKFHFISVQEKRLLFSVWEYLRSQSLRPRLALQIDIHAPFLFCTNTAPRPAGLASAMTLVAAILSKYANVPASATLCFKVLKTSSCSGPY